MELPASMPSDGTLKVTFVPALSAIPKLTEIKATAAKDLSCYLTSDGWNPATDESTITDSRMCSKQDFEQPGRVTESLDIKYVWSTVALDDVARKTLARGVSGYLVVRWGLDVDIDWAVGQEVDIYRIKAGIQKKMPPEANSVHRIDQKTFVTSEVLRDRILVA